MISLERPLRADVVELATDGGRLVGTAGRSGAGKSRRTVACLTNVMRSAGRAQTALMLVA
jgi:ABC-type methionine transport system ATPase subunit